MNPNPSINRSIDDWPHPFVDDLYRRNDPAWTEINQKNFYYMLGVLPPVAMKANAFMPCEPLTHEKDGCPVYTAYCEVAGRYFARTMRVDQFSPVDYTIQIKNQFGI